MVISCKQCLFNSENYPSIVLNNEGICDICIINSSKISLLYPNKNEHYINSMIKKIKSSKKGLYDCLIGISGGLDSSYLVYLAKKWGLNPLLLHVDGGWNSETSVSNISKLINYCSFDFVTEVMSWEEIKDIQKSFIKANVIDIDLPFDNLIMSYTYITAIKYNIKYILSGYSSETEGIMPANYTHYKLDKTNIYSIHKKWGSRKINQLKFMGFYNYQWYNKIRGIKNLSPLDWIEYNKEEARKIIQEKFNWKDYGGKHYENIFTRFYQGYILPKKFDVDKRISHISILICSKQITIEQAYDLLKFSPLYPNPLMEKEDKLFFLKKLEITDKEFDEYLISAQISHKFYKSDLDYYNLFKPIYQYLKKKFQFNLFLD